MEEILHPQEILANKFTLEAKLIEDEAQYAKMQLSTTYISIEPINSLS